MDPQLEQALAGIEAATAGMDAAQLAWRLPGKWSAAEIVEHLGLTYRSTADRLEKALAGGERRLKPDGLRARLSRLVVLGLGYLPTGQPAPEFALPTGLEPLRALEVTRQNLLDMDRVLAECEQRFGRVQLASHFILGPLSADQWRRFHWVHTRHHLRQIEALRQRTAKTKET